MRTGGPLRLAKAPKNGKWYISAALRVSTRGNWASPGTSSSGCFDILTLDEVSPLEADDVIRQFRVALMEK